jgi:integrase
MKGHIRERSPGHWAIVLDVRDPTTGKRKRRWHSFAGTKRQAQIECARLVAELAGGTYLEPSKTTVAEFLDKWLAYMEARLSPRTHERYGELIRVHLKRLVGAVLLTKLRPGQIADAYATAGKTLSSATVIYLHRILKHALSDAVKWDLLIKNPAGAIDPPRIERATVATFDLDQTAELLSLIQGTRVFIPVLLAVMCGLRRGEICALRWRNVDLDGAQIAVVEAAEQTAKAVRYKEPKSGRTRTVALSASVVEALRRHRVQQAEHLLRLGVRHAEDHFVYQSEDGEAMQPRSLTRAWDVAIGRTKLPQLRFHDLRHSHATHLLGSGVHLKIASERLGHSKVSTTADIYMHATKSMQADAAAIVDAAFQDAVNKRTKNKG